AALSIPTYNNARIQSPSFLGAGFVMVFTPNGNAPTCCKKIFWKQWIVNDGSSYHPWYSPTLSADYTAGYTAADFAGDNVNAMGRNRNFGKSFLLQLFCDKEVIWSVSWSYNVNYQ